jgi:hypothetical protein
MRFTSPLDHVHIAAPCVANWNEMTGDARVRFCARCELRVYNLSAMTKREAERLVVNKEDRLCVRFYRRADGTILTQNCPVGLRALKRRVSKIAGAAFAAITSCLVGIGFTIKTETGRFTEQPEPVVEETVAGAMGSPMSMISPLGEQYEAGALLGSCLFLFGYPLLKIRERREARRRAELHIWRRT